MNVQKIVDLDANIRPKKPPKKPEDNNNPCLSVNIAKVK